MCRSHSLCPGASGGGGGGPFFRVLFLLAERPVVGVASPLWTSVLRLPCPLDWFLISGKWMGCLLQVGGGSIVGEAGQSSSPPSSKAASDGS